MTQFYNILKRQILLRCILLLILSIFIIPASSQAIQAIETIQTPDIEAIGIDTKPTIKATIENLNKVDPQKPTITKLQKKSKGEIITDTKDKTQGGSTLNISIKSNKTIFMDNGRNKINIKVDNHGDNSASDTKLVDNKVIYQGSKVDTIVEAVDGGIRQIINIKDYTAPSFYDFPIELEKSEKITFNIDGSGQVIKANGSNKLAILKPWAKDINNKDLKTWYEVVNNSTIRQRIDLANAVFPVLADPIFCGDIFYKVEWENRTSEGGWSLRNYPTYCGRNFDNAWAGFDEILAKAPSRNDLWHSNNRNYTSNQGRSMYNQYRCHWALAGRLWFKDSYNLEPWRPLVPWRELLLQVEWSNNLPKPNFCNNK
jgi:hypothetical protein